MDFRCTNCGATIAGAPPPGTPFTCNYCGAPQQPLGPAPQNPYAPAGNPYGSPPSPFGQAPSPYGSPQNPYGAPPPPYGAAPSPFAGVHPPVAGSRARPLLFVLIAAAIVFSMGSSAAVFLAAGPHAPPVPGVAAAQGMPVATLAKLSLAQTPDAMTKVTGVLAPLPASGDVSMMVPLRGGPYARMGLTWDRADTSHVKMVYLYADTPRVDYAAVRTSLVALLGRRLDKDGNLFWNGGYFSFGLDTARSQGEPSLGPDKNPHWKEQVDAGWDVLRAVVLGLPVTVTAADKRDWLGGGYGLTALGAIDPTVDVDHSTAMMQAAFPSVASSASIGLNHTIAIDHPWYGEAELSWPNEKAGILERLMLRPPPGTNNAFPNQADIEACVQGIVGGKPSRSDEDHLKHTYDTEWKPAEGGEVRVYGHMVDVTLTSHFTPKKMSRAGFQKLMDGLDACGKKR